MNEKELNEKIKAVLYNFDKALKDIKDLSEELDKSKLDKSQLDSRLKE